MQLQDFNPTQADKEHYTPMYGSVIKHPEHHESPELSTFISAEIIRMENHTHP